MVIVDSTVWIDLFNSTQNPQSDWLIQQIPLQKIGLTGLILCEVLQGFPAEATFAEIYLSLSKFDIFDCGIAEVAVASARNYLYFRARGVTVRKTINCLIASFCIMEGYSLLHHDRDFDPFEQHLA